MLAMGKENKSKQPNFQPSQTLEPEKIDPAIHQKIKAAYSTYRILDSSSLPLTSAQSKLAIKTNAICISIYIAKHAVSTDEKRMLLALLNQNEYAKDTPDFFFNIFQREKEAAQESIDKQYEYASLCASYKGVGARQVNIEKLAWLGSCYLKGFKVNVDLSKAFKLFLSAAERGHIESQATAATLYCNGQGVEADLLKAFYWAKLAAKRNNRSAQYVLGHLYLYGKGVTAHEGKAFYYTKLAADQNHRRAHYMLGKLYLEGLGTTKNKERALYHTELAAKQNDADAQYMLGRLYFTGKWGAVDEEKAFHYIQLAADQHHTEAQLMLGQFYLQGIGGVSINEEQAFHYIKLAADKNDGFAQLQLADMLNEQNRDAEAMIYVRRAAQHPDQEIQHCVATFYWWKKRRTPEEASQAITLHLQLANQGHVRSMLILVFCYLELEESEEAEHWLRYLEQSNHPKACNLLMYIDRLNTIDADTSTYMIDLLTLLSNNSDVSERMDKVLQDKFKPTNKENDDDELTTKNSDSIAALTQMEEEASRLQLPAKRSQPISNITILRTRSIKLNNPKLLRQLKIQAGYAKQKQAEMQAIEEKRRKGERIILRAKNHLIAQKICQARNVKLTLGEFSQLFNDPAFNNQVKITPTASGFKVSAKIANQPDKIESTHWPHNDYFDFNFLKGLEEIINAFVSDLSDG
jgi:TPR repeat protein